MDGELPEFPPSGSPARLYAIAPTLFTEGAEEVDGEAMACAAQWIAGHGISDLLLTGAYGEFQSLADDERIDVLRAVRSVPGIRSVIACAAKPATAATARLAARMIDHGADLVMVAPPLLAEVSQRETLRHFEHLSSRFPGRLVIYNNPVFGCDLAPDTLQLLAALPGVVAVKQGTRSLADLVASIQILGQFSSRRVKVLIASDLTAVPGLMAGADGLTSTNSWAFPGAIARLTAAASRGDWQDARQVAQALDPYFCLVRRLGQPRTVKAAMRIRGLPGRGDVRLPYAPLSEEELKELQAVLEHCDAALGEIRKPGFAQAGSWL